MIGRHRSNALTGNRPTFLPPPSRDLAGALEQSTRPRLGQHRSGVGDCPLAKKHFAKVKLIFADDKTEVPSAACAIWQGGGIVNGGPFSNGSLEATQLDGGAVEVSFPGIDASEWDVAE